MQIFKLTLSGRNKPLFLHGCVAFKVHESLFERAFKMMKNGVYFIVIALLVAELFKILVYAN